MKTLTLISFFLMQLSIMTFAQKTEVTFNVNFKGDFIGTMHATETREGTKSTKDLSTKTNVSIFAMSIHVESEVKSAHDNGILLKGIAYRHANRGSEDVIGNVSKIGPKSYLKERNGKKLKLENTVITICVIDLIFQEPKGVNKVFSNMYAEFLELKMISAGKYLLITPDNKNSTYTYKNGKLMTIEVDTPLGKVISTRI